MKTKPTSWFLASHGTTSFPVASDCRQVFIADGSDSCRLTKAHTITAVAWRSALNTEPILTSGYQLSLRTWPQVVVLGTTPRRSLIVACWPSNTSLNWSTWSCTLCDMFVENVLLRISRTRFWALVSKGVRTGSVVVAGGHAATLQHCESSNTMPAHTQTTEFMNIFGQTVELPAVVCEPGGTGGFSATHGSECVLVASYFGCRYFSCQYFGIYL